MSEPSKSGAEFIVDMVLGYRSAKATLVAHQLGVFPLLAEGPLTPGAVAERLSCAPHPTLVLLRALASIGLLAFDGQRFGLTELAAQHLVPGRPGYLGSNLTYQELLWEGWSGLADTVRTGRPKAGLVELLTRGPPGFSLEYLRSVDNLSRAAAQELAQLEQVAGCRRFLDVGCGLGTYARVFAGRTKELQATLFDLPETLALARQALEGDPALERLRFLPGNYLKDDFGTGYDLVLFSHVTHDESAANNALLMRKAFAALRPGGQVAIHDFVVGADGCGPPFAALFSTHMLTYTDGGQVYSVEDYEAMLVAAGFAPRGAQPLLAGKVRHATTVVLGEKPH